MNKHIQVLNKSNSARSVRWDRDLIRKEGRKEDNVMNIEGRKNHQFLHLYDGVHGDTYLCYKWYSFMCNSVKKDIKKPLKSNMPNSDSEDSD